MTDAELDAEARKLYEADDNQVKPTWDQITDYTKLGWHAYVLAGANVC